MRRILRFAAAVLGAALLACSGDSSSDSAPELFDEADRPSLVHDDVHDCELLSPWNYDKSFNSARFYPLVVSLHGSGGSHYKPCIAGNDEEMMAYPCFFLAPTCSDWGSSAVRVRELIVELMSTYRIDPNRLYLMGFSMGGSGSYTFASSLYSEQGNIFAGIVRLAGQSRTSLPEALAGKTSVWYHIGLNDSAERIAVAEQAYQSARSYSGNAAAKESISDDVVAGYSRSTKTLMLGRVQVMKKSEYTGMGHDAGVPFQDPSVLAWLFSQSLLKR